MSAIRPHAKRERSLSSRRGMAWGGAIAGNDDLATGEVEVVENVEEPLLGLFLATDELDVVYE